MAHPSVRLCPGEPKGRWSRWRPNSEWTGGKVLDLVRDVRLDRVTGDIDVAWGRVKEAKVHLVSSEKLAGPDPARAPPAVLFTAALRITSEVAGAG